MCSNYSCCSRSGFIIIIAQQGGEEETSLREKGEDLAGGIVSDFLGDSVGDEGERENDYGDAEHESNQDPTDTATITQTKSRM
jgi:c-di-GMP-binding flagellar brake protein YcgR